MTSPDITQAVISELSKNAPAIIGALAAIVVALIGGLFAIGRILIGMVNRAQARRDKAMEQAQDTRFGSLNTRFDDVHRRFDKSDCAIIELSNELQKSNEGNRRSHERMWGEIDLIKQAHAAQHGQIIGNASINVDRERRERE